jgi:hypothetical protein
LIDTTEEPEEPTPCNAQEGTASHYHSEAMILRTWTPQDLIPVPPAAASIPAYGATPPTTTMTLATTTEHTAANLSLRTSSSSVVVMNLRATKRKETATIDQEATNSTPTKKRLVEKPATDFSTLATTTEHTAANLSLRTSSSSVVVMNLRATKRKETATIDQEATNSTPTKKRLVEKPATGFSSLAFVQRTPPKNKTKSKMNTRKAK